MCYSRPDPNDLQGRDFDRAGGLTASLLAELQPPPDSEAYLCGPTAFMDDITLTYRAIAAKSSCQKCGAGVATGPPCAHSERHSSGQLRESCHHHRRVTRHWSRVGRRVPSCRVRRGRHGAHHALHVLTGPFERRRRHHRPRDIHTHRRADPRVLRTHRHLDQ